LATILLSLYVRKQSSGIVSLRVPPATAVRRVPPAAAARTR
jgi:hypothetical protein